MFAAKSVSRLDEPCLPRAQARADAPASLAVESVCEYRGREGDDPSLTRCPAEATASGTLTHRPTAVGKRAAVHTCVRAHPLLLALLQCRLRKCVFSTASTCMCECARARVLSLTRMRACARALSHPHARD